MTAQETPRQPTAQELLEWYMQLRDRKAQLEAKHKEKLAALNATMEKVEADLMRIMADNGVDKLSVRGVGTAYLATKDAVSGEDWDQITDYIQQTGSLHFLNRALNKSAIREYMAEHDGATPPGVVYRAWKEVNVRKS